MIKNLLSITIIAIVVALGYIGYKAGGSMLERRFHPAVNELRFDTFTCEDGDMTVRGFLDKAEWTWAGMQEAELIGLTVFDSSDPPKRITWRQVQDGDLSPKSRPAGRQTVDLVLVGSCGEAFTLKLRHVSPLTGFVLPSTWGPYTPPS